MKHLISDSQEGFVVEWPILDNIIIVQEAIHSSLEIKQQGMAIKLDMANAFDRVNHFFLFEIMSRLGFSKRFIRWTKACIISPWIATLINGRPSKFFQASRGLRKGFPLSPFLFLLVVESLSRKLQYLQENGKLKGLKISKGDKAATHAQFADDTILHGGDSTKTAKIFNEVLSSFLKASDGKVNHIKSKVYG